jgi:hypothetical protein
MITNCRREPGGPEHALIEISCRRVTPGESPGTSIVIANFSSRNSSGPSSRRHPSEQFCTDSRCQWAEATQLWRCQRQGVPYESLTEGQYESQCRAVERSERDHVLMGCCGCEHCCDLRRCCSVDFAKGENGQHPAPNLHHPGCALSLWRLVRLEPWTLVLG